MALCILVLIATPIWLVWYLNKDKWDKERDEDTSQKMAQSINVSANNSIANFSQLRYEAKYKFGKYGPETHSLCFTRSSLNACGKDGTYFYYDIDELTMRVLTKDNLGAMKKDEYWQMTGRSFTEEQIMGTFNRILSANQYSSLLHGKRIKLSDIIMYKVEGSVQQEYRFNTAGAVVGTLIAGTPGTIIGGSNGSSKEKDNRQITIYYKDREIVKQLKVYSSSHTREVISVLEKLLPGKDETSVMLSRQFNV